GTYVNGVEEGEWTSWFENGQQKTIGTFKAGKMDGLWRGWFPNGDPDYEGNYKDDLEHGPWKLYHQSPPNKEIGGRVREEGSYVEGKKNGRWTTYSIHGTPIAEGVYANGVKSGLW